MIINYPYQTQQVRDLAWACFSPTLLHVEQVVDDGIAITSCAPQLDAERKAWLQNLDRDAGALIAHLSQRPTHRLGLYFEQLWHFFLQHDPAIDLLAHNLAVVHEGITIGEFDCIYYDHRRERHVHLELAVKYFLGSRNNSLDDSGAHARNWVGPDNQDRLDSKLDKLMYRQTVLGNHPAAAQQLLELGIGKLSREVALKGYLFQAISAPLPLPAGYNPDCGLNHWVSCDQLLAHCAKLTSNAFMILPKMRWFSAARCDDIRELLDASQLHENVLEYFARNTYPIMIVALDNHCDESSRFFVTPEHWPLC